jgi:hypothetical protein
MMDIGTAVSENRRIGSSARSEALSKSAAADQRQTASVSYPEAHSQKDALLPRKMVALPDIRWYEQEL